MLENVLAVNSEIRYDCFNKNVTDLVEFNQSLWPENNFASNIIYHKCQIKCADYA